MGIMPEGVDKMIKILCTDTKFYDSPDAGDPACLCSRCGKVIDDAPIRAFL